MSFALSSLVSRFLAFGLSVLRKVNKGELRRESFLRTRILSPAFSLSAAFLSNCFLNLNRKPDADKFSDSISRKGNKEIASPFPPRHCYHDLIIRWKSHAPKARAWSYSPCQGPFLALERKNGEFPPYFVTRRGRRPPQITTWQKRKIASYFWDCLGICSQRDDDLRSLL